MGLHTAVQAVCRQSFYGQAERHECVANVTLRAIAPNILQAGMGVMFDFKEPALAKLVAEVRAAAGKVVSAACHGRADECMLNSKDGRYLLEGKNVTGLSWREEVVAKRDQRNDSLQDCLKERV